LFRSKNEKYIGILQSIPMEQLQQNACPEGIYIAPSRAEKHPAKIQV
jgi:hypothetical protein